MSYHKALPIDFELDVMRYPEFTKLLADDQFCVELWTAFANVEWYKKFDPLDSDVDQVFDVLNDHSEDRRWSASFRGMGRVIAHLRNGLFDTDEDYMNWYCCNGNTPYGYISEQIETSLNAIGWFPIKDQFYYLSNK